MTTGQLWHTEISREGQVVHKGIDQVRATAKAKTVTTVIDVIVTAEDNNVDDEGTVF